VTALKYLHAASLVRAQIADGRLAPGETAPSAAALARVTGYSTLTCRRALRTLINDGALVPGTSRNARPRVPASYPTPGEQHLANAARALSAGLAARRRAAGLTQPQLAAIAGVSVTTVGHAETGRLWQSRRFWERADSGVGAEGDLLLLHDDYRAAQAVPPGPARQEDTTACPDARTAAFAASPGPVAHVTITWADGAVTTVYPPGPASARERAPKSGSATTQTAPDAARLAALRCAQSQEPVAVGAVADEMEQGTIAEAHP
jgi:hypothetical protein